jgi:hypothetical protein
MLDDAEVGAPGVFSPFATLMARDDWPVIVGLPALAAVFVFAVPRLGWWAALLAVVVYAAGFLAFGRSKTASDTYTELVVALGRLPEIDGSVSAGLGERTSQLAGRMGQELNLSPADVALLEAAARCRHVGRVGRDAAPFVRQGFDDDAAARWSRDIVAASPRLAAVAGVLDPDATGELPAIVDAAAAYVEARSVSSSDEALRVVGDAWAQHPEIIAALSSAVAAMEA